MYDTLRMTAPSSPPRWRELVWPKEHGSWSLVFEPVALGLLVAPSWAGLALAGAVAAAFFARRPLRTAVNDAHPVRRAAARRAVDICGILAAAGFAGSLFAAGFAWTLWLLPTTAAGAVFLFFDVQKAGREQYAEVAGAAAFGWLPAAFAAAAGWPVAAAAALGTVMLARAVPTVLAVRALLRSRKAATTAGASPAGERGGAMRIPLAAAVGPMCAALLACVVVGCLAHARLAPIAAAVFAAFFVLRSFAWLAYPRVNLRASTLGMMEAALGVAYVGALVIGWRI